MGEKLSTYFEADTIVTYYVHCEKKFDKSKGKESPLGTGLPWKYRFIHLVFFSYPSPV